MTQVERFKKCTMVNENIENIKEIMTQNLNQMMEREEELNNLDQDSEKLSEMSKLFKKRSKEVKIFKAWQNTKHGNVVGDLVMTGVALFTVPPLLTLF